MKLLTQFQEYLKSKNVDLKHILIQETEHAVAIKFFEKSQGGELYQIIIAFLKNDNDVEVIVKQEPLKEVKNKLILLEKLNELNMKYFGTTFVFDKENSITIKHGFETNGELKKALIQLTRLIKIADEEFKNLK